MTLLLAVCLCTASSFSALEIVESPSGALTVVRDGKTIIEDIAVNAGEVPGSEIRSSFELLPDGSKVWNRWCEACDRRYRLEVAQRSDGAVEITLAGQMEGSSRFRTRAVYLRSAPGVFIGKKFKGVVGNGRSWNPLEGETGDALRKYGFRWFALEGLTFDLDPIGPTDYCMQYNQGVVQGVWTIIPEGGGLKFIGGTTVKTSFGGFVGAKVVIRKGSFEDYISSPNSVFRRRRTLTKNSTNLPRSSSRFAVSASPERCSVPSGGHHMLTYPSGSFHISQYLMFQLYPLAQPRL